MNPLVGEVNNIDYLVNAILLAPVKGVRYIGQQQSVLEVDLKQEKWASFDKGQIVTVR